MNRARGGALPHLALGIQGLGDCRIMAPPAVWAHLIKVPEDVPLPVLRGHLNRPSEMTADSRFGGLLSQVRLARVDDLWVGEDVDQGRPAGGEGALQRRLQLTRLADEDPVAAERFDQLVV